MHIPYNCCTSFLGIKILPNTCGLIKMNTPPPYYTKEYELKFKCIRYWCILTLLLILTLPSVWLVATDIKVLGAYKPHNLSEPEPPVKLVYERHLMSAYEIYLPEISAHEREQFETPPADKRHNKIGIHRDVPGDYLGQLVPWLNWQTDDKGTVAYLMLH